MPHKHLNDQKLCQKQNLKKKKKKKKKPIFLKKFIKHIKKLKKKIKLVSISSNLVCVALWVNAKSLRIQIL